MSLYYYDKDSGELYHYGVLGMKWGKRKAKPASDGIRNAYKRTQNAKQKLQSAKAKKKTAKKSYDADKQYKSAKKAYKALKKIEKATYKEAVKQRAKEIQKGASIIERIWNANTNSHIYQAQIEVEMERRGQK